MELAGEDLGRFQQAILGAYNKPALEQLLRIKMNIRLDELVKDAGFRDVVFGLLKYLESKARLIEFLRVARADNPAKLRQELDELEQKLASASPTSASGCGPAPLTITRVRIDSPHWETHRALAGGAGPAYPFDEPCAQYHSLRAHLELQNPLFDVLVTNNLDRNVLVLSVGVIVVSTADTLSSYGVGGQTFRVTREDHFAVPMPRLRTPPGEMRPSAFPMDKEDIKIERRDALVLLELADPVAIPPQQPYRFGLELKDYIDNMPNHVTARIVIETDQGRADSELFYLFIYY